MSERRLPRVLAIDDDPLFLRSIARLVGAWGFACETYRDGRAGLAALHADPPDVLLLDVFMPEPDGFEIIADLRGRGIAVPIVAISGDILGGRPTHMLAACEQLGVTAAMQKPIDPERLRTLLAGLVAPSAATPPQAP